MRSSKSLILGAVGIAVLALIALLLLKVGRDPATAVDDEKIAEAERQYRRAQAAKARAQIEPVGDTARTPPRIKSRPSLGQPTSDAEDTRPSAPRQLPPSAGATIPIQELRPLSAGAGGAEDGDTKKKMDGANKLYDRADYEGARDEALKILEEDPNQRRMLRIVVSSSCIMGDHDTAEEYYGKLPSDRDRRQMARRCSRYGVDLE